jgi:hypothetical protein
MPVLLQLPSSSPSLFGGGGGTETGARRRWGANHNAYAIVRLKEER